MAGLAVCIPSRGLVHSRTIDSLQYIPAEYQLYLTHDKPIPDCFNDLTQRVLKDGHDVLWFIEEDIVIRPDTYHKMLEHIEDNDVVAYNYSITPEQDSVDESKFGTGCTMIKADVLKDYTWKSDRHRTSDGIIMIPDKAQPRMYGLHDIEFAHHCEEYDIPVKRIMDKVGHYKVKEMGQKGRNHGWHIVKEAGEL